ncbi:Uncharacterized protein y4aS [Candidatus Protochlamydia amoebophila]|uniref:GNAT family N-acetyltransferase n=1 Tax=Candidatus Protochlamydia amoebophila TaxID=362787 RepID=UPI001BC966C0|nr:GNAT family N-acetyltransferase [Candidatus Protochlamydia amoebophila]MBS4164688.1 Uncharacterized protein y4aS [Candidatus Protochlamydia amoebophila]
MPITKSIDDVKPIAYKNFSCGIQELDEYLKRFAKANHKKGIGKTFVFFENEQVIGFYTISMACIEFKNVPEKHSSNLPRYPIPAARIGRLAVDNSFQGKHVGKILLIDALERISKAAYTIAAHAVIVDAKNEKAKMFYEHFGFIPYKDEPMSLYLPLITIEELFK